MATDALVQIHTPSEVLDSTLAHILCGESPMDTRVSMHEAPLYVLTTAEKNFELSELSKLLFLVLAEHSEDIFYLGELCGLASPNLERPFLNYAEFFYKLDNNQEIEFLAESSSQDHMVHRFKLLAIVDALFSIAKLSIVKSSVNHFRFDINGYAFRETYLLMRNFSIIYYFDKLSDKPKFKRTDGVQDVRFSRFAPRRKSMLKAVVEKLTGNQKERFEGMVKNALLSQEKEMNERFYDIIQRLFDNIKQAKSENARKGPPEKEYISNMTEAIYNFMSQTTCANPDQFKRAFGEIYDEDNPYVSGKNEYYVSSENFNFCRRYIGYANHERDAPVPESSFATAFKKASSRLKQKNNKFTG